MTRVRCQAWTVVPTPCDGCGRMMRGRDDTGKGEPLFLWREEAMPRGQYLCRACAKTKGFELLDGETN